jgi:hypothetical protein
MVLPSAGAKVPSSVTILNSTLEMQCLLLHEYPFYFLINDHVVAVACLLFLEERFLVIPKPSPRIPEIFSKPSQDFFW